MKLTAKALEAVEHRAFLNKEVLAKKTLKRVSTDSRTVAAGDLFVAIRGERFDGHSFIDEVFRRGALAAVVDYKSDLVPFVGKPFLVVENTVHALGAVARMHRQKFKIPVLAVAGSNGKTTTKDMITAVLKKKMNVLSSEGNLNNHIGVPMTMLRLTQKYQAAVIEIGTNHPGEIEYLCSILQPTHGIITNVGREHLEFLHSIEGVAQEEGALFNFLRKGKGIAFVNSDDSHVRVSARRMKRTVTYGFHTRKAVVRGTILKTSRSGCNTISFSTKGKNKTNGISLRVPGEHNAMNALAATAVGHSLGVSEKVIANTLSHFRPTEKRMEVLNLGGVLVLNDTYNANPDSMIAAVQTLDRTVVRGKKIAVLADMLELGEQSEKEHARVGAEIAHLGVDYVLTFGEYARFIHEECGNVQTVHYDQKNMLAEYLAELITAGDAVLVKGSRGMRMEDIVMFLEERSKSTIAPIV